MKNKNLYDKTVAILVKAYLNDTLQHCECTACAVGNIVAGNLNIGLEKRGNQVYLKDESGMSSGRWFGAISYGRVKESRLTEEILHQIKSTGYTAQQLADIEQKFEHAYAPYGTDDDFEPEWMYNGLMAVVQVLGEIHEVSQEVTEETKLLFAK